jgi:predicted dehydrogenase
MRVVVLSYSHHGRGIGKVVQALGHEIIGVMDAEQGPRLQLEEAFDCPGYATSGACLDAAAPDVALVAGKHIEMPDHIRACVNRRIPYLLDKPFADCAARLRPVAEASAKHGVFSALTLPNRCSSIVGTVKEMVADGRLGELVLYGSRLNNGPPSRYDPSPSAWHNDPSVSGGGSWAVEAAHGIDTFLQFAGHQPVSVVGAVMSNALHRRAVEDIGLGLLRTESGITGTIESGYSYPSGVRGGDHFFRFIGTKASVFAQYGKQGEPLIEVHTTEGVEISEDVSHGERMRRVVDAALAALAQGREFEVTVLDAVRILEIQDAVYDYARANAKAVGPHPMGAPAVRP